MMLKAQPAASFLTMTGQRPRADPQAQIAAKPQSRPIGDLQKTAIIFNFV